MSEYFIRFIYYLTIKFDNTQLPREKKKKKKKELSARVGLFRDSKYHNLAKSLWCYARERHTFCVAI
jgi:hypothetical protein